MNTTSTPLLPGLFYHIFNCGDNREDIFLEDRNYLYFLQLWAKYIEPVTETYAYCLLKNHFHALVRIKPEEDLTGFPLRGGNLSGLGSRQFSNMFNAYARVINAGYHRTGALFQRPFGRILVTRDAQLLRLTAYIHQNPQKHGFVPNFRSWRYSSYPALVSVSPTHLRREEVLEWFGGVKGMDEYHQAVVEESLVKEWVEDDAK